MKGRLYGKQEFNATYVLAQIILIQSAFFMMYGVVCFCFDGARTTTSKIFDPFLFSFSSLKGVERVVGFLVVSTLESVVVARWVERSKKCLDFVLTYHFFYFLLTCLVIAIPRSPSWWSTMVASCVIATVISERLCQLEELRELELVPRRIGDQIATTKKDSSDGSELV
eukprot:Trichotokara_eunicae@DN3942_c0_g1_i1.p1